MKFVIITLHQSCMYMMYMYFSPLRHPTHLHGRPGWTAGYMGGWSVGVSNFHRYSGVPIHSRGRRASQAVGSANCVISVITSRSVVWADYRKTMSTHAAVALLSENDSTMTNGVIQKDGIRDIGLRDCLPVTS